MDGVDGSVKPRLLIGCCGSGKTTVTSYALGSSFRCNRRTGKLETENPMEGFVTSAQCADVTKGLMSAEASGCKIRRFLLQIGLICVK